MSDLNLDAIERDLADNRVSPAIAAALVSEVRALRERVATLEGEGERLDDEIEALAEDNDDLGFRVAQLTVGIREHRDEIREASGNLSMIGDSNEQLWSLLDLEGGAA